MISDSQTIAKDCLGAEVGLCLESTRPASERGIADKCHDCDEILMFQELEASACLFELPFQVENRHDIILQI